MAEKDYIHGFSKEEQERLIAQNNLVGPYIHQRISLKDGINVLEVGCGVGAQMIHMLEKYPNIKITGVDISKKQLDQAKKNLENKKIQKERYQLLHTSEVNFKNLDQSFDSIIMVWVLEHVMNPTELLHRYKPLLKIGGDIYLTEVFHSSFKVFPVQPNLYKLWNESLSFQKEIGGNADIGMELSYLLKVSGYSKINSRPYNLFWDINNQNIKLQFFDYWKELLESAYTTMEQNNKASYNEWNRVIEEFNSLKENKASVFYYTFIQAKAKRM